MPPYHCIVIYVPYGRPYFYIRICKSRRARKLAREWAYSAAWLYCYDVSLSAINAVDDAMWSYRIDTNHDAYLVEALSLAHDTLIAAGCRKYRTFYCAVNHVTQTDSNDFRLKVADVKVPNAPFMASRRTPMVPTSQIVPTSGGLLFPPTRRKLNFDVVPTTLNDMPSDSGEGAEVPI